MADTPDSTFAGNDTRNNMARNIPRGKPGTASGRYPMRQPTAITAEAVEREPFKHIALALIHLRQQLDKLPRMIVDYSRPFDEYQPQSVSEAETQIVVQPAYDMDEIVQFILVTGPAGAVTLQLGDRIIPLTIPASGFIYMGPVTMRLARNDPRTLTTSGAAGQYNLELMGYADNVRGI